MTQSASRERCCSPPSPRRFPRSAQQNIILFVADGLRAAAVSPERAPTFAKCATPA